MSHVTGGIDACCGVTLHILCEMTQIYVWHDSILCLWHDSNVCVTSPSRVYVVQRRLNSLMSVGSWRMTYLWYDWWFVTHDLCVIYISDVLTLAASAASMSVGSWRMTYVIWLMVRYAWLLCDTTDGTRSSYVWCDWWDSIIICVIWLMGLEFNMCDAIQCD